jgi:hypothetical protein
MPQQVECPRCLCVSLKKVLLSYLFHLAWSWDILRQDACVRLQITFLSPILIFNQATYLKLLSFKRLVNARLHVFKTQRVVYLRFAERSRVGCRLLLPALRRHVKVGISKLFAVSNRSGRPILMCSCPLCGLPAYNLSDPQQVAEAKKNKVVTTGGVCPGNS